MLAIGRILRTHGYKGDLRLFIDERYREAFRNMRTVSVQEGQHFVPYFISRITEASRGEFLVQFDEFSNKESAMVLNGMAIFAREEDLPELPEESGYASFTGYFIEDDRFGNLGAILQILEYPGQWLAVISYSGNERLIPLHEDLILGTDKKKKILFTKLPEGLLEI